jgi:hypothetical protein
MARSALVRACRGPLDCRAAAAWAPQCGPGALSEAPPRESAGFGRVWPSRLALKYKGEVDCYEVEQGASLPLLQRLEVTRCTYTPAHPLASPSKVTRARPPTHPYTPLHTLTGQTRPVAPSLRLGPRDAPGEPACGRERRGGLKVLSHAASHAAPPSAPEAHALAQGCPVPSGLVTRAFTALAPQKKVLRRLRRLLKVADLGPISPPCGRPGDFKRAEVKVLSAMVSMQKRRGFLRRLTAKNPNLVRLAESVGGERTVMPASQPVSGPRSITPVEADRSLNMPPPSLLRD